MRGFWHWLPGRAIGPFIFGELVQPYIADYGLCKRKPDCSIADWETYEVPGFESWIVVKNERIIEVYCVDEVKYSDRDIIGMLRSDVLEILGKEDENEENVGCGYALYYYEMGLTLFIENDVVAAAACGLILNREQEMSNGE